MRVGIVGLGLMGGSWALALKKADQSVEILGFDALEQHKQEALRMGLVSQVTSSLEELADLVDQIVLTIPVDVIEHLLPNLLDRLSSDQVVIDFGSTKSSIAKSVVNHANRTNYIAAHPIAGTEYSGPEAAFSSLYQDKVMIVCDSSSSDKSQLSQFVSQCDQIGMELVYQTSEEHDLHLAYVSHLSHVTSFSLSNAVLKKEKEEKQILALAGSGFASTVRLAKSSPEMWSPIFLKNKIAMLEAVEAYLLEVQRFKNYLEAEDAEAIQQFLQEGRAIRKILK
jgi:prephenate dehydrogenase